MIPDDWCTFWVDGSVGPKRYKRAASAFVVYTFDYLILGLQCIPNRNSTEAEWNAALIALEYAFQHKMERARVFIDVQHQPRPGRNNPAAAIVRAVNGHLAYERNYKVEYMPHPDDTRHPGGVAHYAAKYASRQIPIGPVQVFKIPKINQRLFHTFLPNGQNWRIL